MSMTHRALCSLGIAVFGTATIAAGQVPVTQEPRHRVVFEDARMRILDVNVPAGDTTLEHIHERDIVTVSLSAADTRTQSPGQPWSATRPRRALGHAAATEYTGKPGIHRVENVDTTLYRLIAIENRSAGTWTTAAAAAGAGTSMATESRAFRVYDVRLDRDTPQTDHRHEVPVIVVLVSGSVTAHVDSAPQSAPLAQAGEWRVVGARERHRLETTAGSQATVVEIEVR